MPKPPTHAGRKRHAITPAFWERCYRNDDAFWDHGAPSPGLVHFLQTQRYRPGTVLVPGCGFGHDCRELAKHGFKVTGLDISPRAMTEARKISAGITYRVGDFLKPGRTRYDWVFEHTCFCAIDPALRDQYVAALRSRLKPGGRFLGVFYNIQPKVGPPFGTTRGELLERFGSHFRLLMEKVPPSYPNRTGKELLMLWEKKS